ncbi:phage distal tail protein [Jeotgalibacillus haloalkalitolerans]|uniref:Phage tail family protein n=1 Tax=Jeotgalibacillus haloalkalitolerans TaxID=3104292 RepID=A0ABU5KK94_9BACL|nr:phage tail domain-containing protein [Jeotgalibacillus sp. HH7-29]MDZ5711666.1 phage tail family protein [Jeotgalibacillus sp. HH7-29]
MYAFEYPGTTTDAPYSEMWCEITNRLGQTVKVESRINANYQLLFFDGLGEVGAESQTVKTSRSDGDRFITNRLLPRPIQIIFNLKSDFLSKIPELRREVSRVINPRLSPFIIKYKEPGMPAMWIEASCDGSPSFSSAQAQGFHTQRSGVNFTANDPYWRSEMQEHVMTAYDEAFSFPFTFPVEFGTQGQLVSIENNGHEVSMPRIEIEGPVDRPSIENLSTGEKFTLNRAIQTGETLVIDNQNKSVRILSDDGSVNAARWKTFDSRWITVQLGENDIQYTAVAGSSGGTATVFYYDRLVGI